MPNFDDPGTLAQQTVQLSDIIQRNQTVSLFGNLLGLVWRDVGIPYVDFKIALDQDLAIHKFADLDGADVEPTGRNPIRMSARIPFLNHIAKATHEQWDSGDQYPANFRRFWAAITDRSPDYLQHPEFGLIYCVVSHAEVDWKASTRDGVYVDVTWIETFEPDGGVNLFTKGVGGAISQGSQAGIDLDKLLPQLPPSAFPSLPPQTTSFADFARGLQGVADQVSLLQYQTAGKIDSVISQVQTTLSAFSQATGQQGNGPGGPQSQSQQDLRNRVNEVNAAISVQSWPTRDACDRYISALANIKENLLSSGKRVSLFIPANDTSLPMIATTLPASIADLMNLNPSLLSKLIVPHGTVVRYYANAVSPPGQALGGG